jgi:hypothetical protein
MWGEDEGMADRSERLKHLFPQAVTSARAFVTPKLRRDPNTPPAYPQRSDPAGHARSLLQQLAVVQSEGSTLEAERIAEHLQDCSGVVVDVLVVPNADISLQSLSDERAGIELLTVTELSAQLVQATLFVPEGKLVALERKIRAFAPADPEKEARNVPLVSSLESIRRAVARSFWSDLSTEFPTGPDSHWWEVWLRRGVEPARFRRHAEILKIHVGARELRFPDRVVLLVRASIAEMTRSAALLDSIAELRSAPPLDLELAPLDPTDEEEFANDLAKRLSPAPPNAPSVCLLDTGVDYDHPLLRAALARTSVLSCFGEDVHDRFGNNDWHGTGSAGLAVFGLELPVALVSSEEWRHTHHLESVKYIPSTGQNDPELYGDVTKEAVARAEVANPTRTRIVATTVTAAATASGEPTSWSSAIDQLCSGYDDEQRLRRLVVLPTGNVVPRTGYTHPATNHLATVEDPAQAWNAVTVGAYTTRTLPHGTSTWSEVAEPGTLSPSARTSLAWERGSREAPPPLKPDFVCEGGNWGQERSGSFPTVLRVLSPISTRRRDGLASRSLAPFGATSGAAAIGANLAAQLQAEYPRLWPESIRALLAHSCRYTNPMQQSFAQETKRKAAEARLRCFGYGVPDFERARYSARNELTLILEREIQPFRVAEDGTRGTTNEMHLHQLPWPSDLLEQLGALPVRLRVSLSYFIDPNPGKRGIVGDTRTKIVGQASYPSFGLRFDVAKAREKPDALVRRVNAAERQGKVSEAKDYAAWDLGGLRARGSLHSDVWRGTAADLADKHAVVVYPVNGWWRFRHKKPEICAQKTRYALVISIETDHEEVDVYTPVMAMIGIER